MKLLNFFTSLYPVWLILAAFVAFVTPGSMQWIDSSWINGALVTVMLGMGFTLKVDDFRNIAKNPGIVSFGFLLQYATMPLTAWAIASLMQLDPGFTVGLILLGSCPGGTASNVITYLARADLALSVILTMASTLLAFIMTPLWCQTLAGQIVPVDGWGLAVSTFQVIVAPVLIGVACNYFFPRQVSKVVWLGPILSVLAICLITGGIVAHSATELAQHALQLVIAVVLLHTVGFLLGYWIPVVFKVSERECRTISIECGMQNGGMAAMLAKNHFTAHPLAAVPAVVSALVQNIMGSLLAAWWRMRPAGDVELSSPESLDILNRESTDSNSELQPTPCITEQG